VLLQNYYDTLPLLAQLQLCGETVMQKQPQPFYLKSSANVPKDLDTSLERSSQDLPASSKISDDADSQGEEMEASQDDPVRASKADTY
jgi:hypothetical protein